MTAALRPMTAALRPMTAALRPMTAALAAVALAACSGEPLAPRATTLGPPTAALPEGSSGRIEVRRLDARPRLTLVARDGDPAPAVAVVFVTDVGPALTVALAAVVESRLAAAGFEPDVRVDRDAFRVRFSIADPARAPALFAAVAGAVARPIAPGGPEIALATQRLQSLKRNPLDAPELAAAAACTGALGIAPGEPLPDLATEPGARALEGARRAALHAGNAAVAVVGPAAFGAAVARALERSEGWPPPAPAGASPTWPAGDAAGVYTATAHDEGAPTPARAGGKRASPSPYACPIRSPPPPQRSGWERPTRPWWRGCACCPKRGGPCRWRAWRAPTAAAWAWCWRRRSTRAASRPPTPHPAPRRPRPRWRRRWPCTRPPPSSRWARPPPSRASRS